MKIHIVQKDDTLWKLAEKYGVNFEELKKVNSQLSNPDMLMPGMKIKIPTGAVQAKPPGSHHGKEVKKPEVGAKMEIPKAELPVKELPKMEIPKMELPKMEVPKIDENKLKMMIKEAVAELLPSVLRSLLQHLKPEIINQIKIDLELSNTEIKYQNLYTSHPEPPPMKKEPVPYKPKKVKPIMEPECPPYPPSHYYITGNPIGLTDYPMYAGMQHVPGTPSYPLGGMASPAYSESPDEVQEGMPGYDGSPQQYGSWPPQTQSYGYPSPDGWWQSQPYGMQSTPYWGMQQPGLGMPQSVGGMGQAGIPTQQPFGGMGQAGIPTQQPFGGMEQAGIPMQQPFSGMEQAGIPMQQAFSGMEQAGMPMQQPFSGMEQAGIPMQQAFSGMEQAGIPMQQSFSRTEQEGMPMQQPFSGTPQMNAGPQHSGETHPSYTWWDAPYQGTQGMRSTEDREEFAIPPVSRQTLEEQHHSHPLFAEEQQKPKSAGHINATPAVDIREVSGEEEIEEETRNKASNPKAVRPAGTKSRASVKRSKR